MKKIVACFVLLCALLALGVGAWHLCTARTAPSISVWLQDNSGGGGGPGIPAVDNYVSGDSGSSGRYTHVGNFRVVASSHGSFFVLAHYRVVRDGAVADFDVNLPVNPRKPVPDHWVKLNDHLAAVAFYDGSTIIY